MALLKPATPGTLVVLAATVLLVLVSVSTPLLKSVYFLSANFAATQNNINADVRLGVWGFCSGDQCVGPTFGYDLNANSLLGIPRNVINLPNSLIRGLTYCLIVHPIAAGFAAAATLCGLLGHIREMSIVLTVVSTWLAGIASTLSLLAFIFDIVLFTIAKSRINSASNGTVAANASYGNAIWLTLAAFVLLAISGCFFGCGRRIVGARDAARRDTYKPAVDPGYSADARQNAFMADRLRQEDLQKNGGSNVGSGFLGKSNARKEQGLPAFAETGESVPLRSYAADDEDTEAQNINGVGMGYGRRNDGASDHTGTTSGAAGLGAAGVGAAALASRQGREHPSHVESFHSMNPSDMGVSPTSQVHHPPLPVSSSYMAMPAPAAATGPQPAGYGAYPTYDPDVRSPSPTSSYGPSTIPAWDNARPSAIPFVPSSASGAAALPGAALPSSSHENYGSATSRPYYQSQATPASNYTETPQQHYGQPSFGHAQQLSNGSSFYPGSTPSNLRAGRTPPPPAPPTYYTSNSEDPYAHVGAVTDEARRRQSENYDLGSYYDGSPAVQHPTPRRW